jgi:hypothetical protein
MTIAEQTKQIILQNKKERMNLREQKKLLNQVLILRKKEEDDDYIKNYILTHYDITRNIKDRIQSSKLNERINHSSTSFMNTEKVKLNVLTFNGIISKRTKGCVFYCGLIEKISSTK